MLTRLTWKEILTKDWETERYLLEPYLPAGATVLLDGCKSVGKSAIIIEWAAAVADGIPWLGLPVMKGKVLIIEADQPIGSLKSRLQRYPRSPDSVTWLAGTGNLMVPSPSEEVLKAITETASDIKPDLVIVNTLRKATNQNLNDSVTVQQVYGWFRYILGQHPTLLFLHHPKKTQAEGGTNQNETHSGSHAWRDDATMSLKLEPYHTKRGRPTTARLRMTGSQVGPLYRPLLLNLAPGGIGWSSPIYDELLEIQKVQRETKLYGPDLDKALVARKLVGSLSTARNRRVQLATLDNQVWLGLDHVTSTEEGDEDNDN